MEIQLVRKVADSLDRFGEIVSLTTMAQSRETAAASGIVASKLRGLADPQDSSLCRPVGIADCVTLGENCRAMEQLIAHWEGAIGPLLNEDSLDEEFNNTKSALRELAIELIGE